MARILESYRWRKPCSPAGPVGVIGLAGLFYPLVEALSYGRQLGIMLFALWAAAEGAMGLGAKGHVAAE